VKRVKPQNFQISIRPSKYHHQSKLFIFELLNLMILIEYFYFADILCQTIFPHITSTTLLERELSFQKLDPSISSSTEDTFLKEIPSCLRSTSRERTPTDSSTSLTLTRLLSELRSELFSVGPPIKLGY